MINVNFIRNNSKKFDQCMKARKEKISSNQILSLDIRIKKLKIKINSFQNLKNDVSSKLFSCNSKIKKYKERIKRSLYIKNKLFELQIKQKILIKNMNYILTTIPNILSNNVPYGEFEDEKKIIKELCKINIYKYDIKSHYKLALNLSIMDFKNAIKMSGSRFVILKKDLVILERALVSFMLDIVNDEFGYDEISPPYIVLESIMFKVGQLPKFSNDSFSIRGKYRLIPTSEVSLAAILENSILGEGDLPQRYTAYTPCFRSEAGSSSKDTKGLIRLHQFSKIELFSATLPINSYDELDRIIFVAERILKKLDLPYRVSLLCSQDTSFCSAKTYDLEVWMPFQKSYREISSCSNCLDFQALRMNARYKSSFNRKNYFFHTLNGSSLAIGRTIAALLENYQNFDGSIKIPDNLVKYMNKDIIKMA